MTKRTTRAAPANGREGIHEEAMPIATSNQLVDASVAGNLDIYPESSAYPALAVELQSPGRLKIFAASAITKQKPFDALLVPMGMLLLLGVIVFGLSVLRFQRDLAPSGTGSRHRRSEAEASA